ncbi:myo-inosose-2 dehydratase [Microbacterium aoyamense]|uniref:Myo-inosose-2 dehydratase n=2 Tax=Microbacterium aoyamense TaxID=344166 RepID=A0ABP5ATI0_9MICO
MTNPSIPNIRFGTNLIGFFDAAFLGHAPGAPRSVWVSGFEANPRDAFDKMLDGVRDAGLEGVELAPNPGGWERALQAYGSTAGLKKALDERGLVLTSSYAHGKQLIGAALEDPAAEAIADDAFERHARFLAEMGADTIVSGNLARSRFGDASPDDTATPEDFAAPVLREVHQRFADQLNRLGAIVGAHGVKIAIHTDAYSICSREADIATLMALTDPATVQLCPDAGHIALDGGDPVAVLRQNIDRVPTMHWKDCAAPLSGHVLRGDGLQRHDVMLTYFRILGSGTVDWRGWMEVLREHGWRGWASEEIDNSPDPVGELRQGLEYFRTELAPIYS